MANEKNNMMEEELDDVLILVDEEDQEHPFQMIDMVEVDGSPQYTQRLAPYAAPLPLFMIFFSSFQQFVVHKQTPGNYWKVRIFVRGQTHRAMRPTICSSATQPTVLLRLSMEVSR